MKERAKVLVVDGGGRGAALVDKYAQSDHVSRVFAVPGNDLMGVNSEKPVQTYPNLKTTSIKEIIEICKDEKVDLADVAQDNAVAAGLVNVMQGEGIPVIGPTREAGQVEWSKAWAREFGDRHELPQPSFTICRTMKEGIGFINSQSDQPWFIKADGLTEGKGSLPAHNNNEAVRRIKELKNRFSEAAQVYLIERWLDGEEFSTFIFSDGESFRVVGSAQDHKRVFNHDQGENTGGMGCSSPPLLLTPEIIGAINKQILTRTTQGLRDEGRIYKGVLYLGGMVAHQDNNPYVIEFNARWGDPEAQVILPGLVGDLFEVSMAIVAGNISKASFSLDGKSRVVVAGVSRGYPGDYSSVRGKRVYGLDEAMKTRGVKVYSAGISVEDGVHYANGGRLFYIVGEGATVIESRQRAYEAIAVISVEGNNLHYRTDIGWRDMERLKQ